MLRIQLKKCSLVFFYLFIFEQRDMTEVKHCSNFTYRWRTKGQINYKTKWRIRPELTTEIYSQNVFRGAFEIFPKFIFIKFFSYFSIPPAHTPGDFIKFIHGEW